MEFCSINHGFFPRTVTFHSNALLELCVSHIKLTIVIAALKFVPFEMFWLLWNMNGSKTNCLSTILLD